MAIKKKSSRGRTENPSAYRKPTPRGFVKEKNKKIADDLLAAKADIRNGTFDYNTLAEKHGVTYQVVLGVLQRMRRQKKIAKKDPFVRPIGEKWKNAAPLRESERKKFITEHLTWDHHDLAGRLGFKHVNTLRNFARIQSPPIKLKPVSANQKKGLSKQALAKEQTDLGKEIREFLSARIAEGALVDPKIGVNKLYDLVRSTFAERLKTTQALFQKADFPDLLDEVCWTKQRLDLLREVLRSDLPLEVYANRFDNIPFEMVKRRVPKETGLVTRRAKSPKFLRGLGRLDLGEIDPKALAAFRFPEATVHKPYRIPAGKQWSLMTMVPNVGILYDRASIELNVPRLALSYARQHNVDGVIVSSVFDIDTTKAGGPAKVYRALLSGIRTKPENLAESYQEEAKRILDEQKLGPRELRLVYMTFAEKFDAVLEALDKIFNRLKDNDKPELGTEPEYNGPVTVVFGYKEEVLIAAVAYAEARAATLKRQREVAIEMKIAEKAFTEASSVLQELGIRFLSEDEAQLVKDFLSEHPELLSDTRHNMLSYEDVAANVREELKGTLGDQFTAGVLQVALVVRELEIERLDDEHARLTITNVSDQDYRLEYLRTRALVVKKVEETIPGSHVVSIGSCSVQVGDEEWGKINLHVPSDQHVSQNILAPVVAAHGPVALRGELAPTTIILHPHALSFGEAVRENDVAGVRNEARFYVSPIALDDEYIRMRLTNTVRHIHPIAKAAFNNKLASGVLILHGNDGMVNGSPVLVSELKRSALALREKKSVGKKRKHKHVPFMHNITTSYIYVRSDTDPHYASRNQALIWCEELQRFLAVDEALKYGLRRQGLLHSVSDYPFHISVVNDDPIQGNHFQVQKQPNPHELPIWEIEEMWRGWRVRMEQAKDSRERLSIMREAQRINLRQFAVRPPDWYVRQLELFCERYVSENLDVINATLMKASRAGLVFKGASEFGDTSINPKDSRDIGCVNFGGSNHEAKTTNFEMISGPHIARLANAELRAEYDEWRGRRSELERLVRSPLYSNRTFAWGTVKAPGGYEYVFDLRDTPPRLKGWNDVIAGWVEIDSSRGNYQGFAEGKFALKLAGDKHFHSVRLLSYALYAICGPGTHTDLFGEHGFPPNNTGISIFGLPVDGPGSGPFIVRYFPYSKLKRLVEHPEIEFDWKTFLPNPL